MQRTIGFRLGSAAGALLVSAGCGASGSGQAAPLPQVRVDQVPALPGFESIGPPEQLRRRRPRMRMAERRLAAATGRLGVAVGDRFPKVTLTQDMRNAAPGFSHFGRTGARIFAVGPSIRGAAFDLGWVHQGIESAQAQTKAALAAYEDLVLSASDKAAYRARKHIEAGLIDFVEVLGAERTAMSAELLLSQGRTGTATSLGAVYKASGARWAAPGTAP